MENPYEISMGSTHGRLLPAYGLTRSDPEWVFWCKTHAKPMKNPLWVLSEHNGLTHLKPEQDPVGLAIWVLCDLAVSMDTMLFQYSVEVEVEPTWPTT